MSLLVTPIAGLFAAGTRERLTEGREREKVRKPETPLGSGAFPGAPARTSEAYPSDSNDTSPTDPATPHHTADRSPFGARISVEIRRTLLAVAGQLERPRQLRHKVRRRAQRVVV